MVQLRGTLPLPNSTAELLHGRTTTLLLSSGDVELDSNGDRTDAGSKLPYRWLGQLLWANGSNARESGR